MVTRSNTVNILHLDRLLWWHCTAIGSLDYQKNETSVVVFPYPMDGPNARSHSGTSFWLYTFWSIRTHFELLFASFAYLFGFLQQCELYGLRVPPTLWLLIRLDFCISCCDWSITYLYFSLTYIFSNTLLWDHVKQLCS